MSPRLATLRWVVEVRDPHAWEPIAAFNVQCIAESYARECHQGRFGRAYRVRELPGPQDFLATTTLELEARAHA